MHKAVMGVMNSLVDHINGNTLDNRKSNLRVATVRQNKANSSSKKGSISKYKGVTYCKYHKKWKAAIKFDGVNKHLGYFNNESDAAKAYDKFAVS